MASACSDDEVELGSNSKCCKVTAGVLDCEVWDPTTINPNTGEGTAINGGANCPNGDIVIPAGKGITHIGVSAFDSCLEMTSVTLPEGLTHIGQKAFHRPTDGTSDDDLLTSVTFPSTLVEIGDYAFDTRYNLKTIDLSPTNLTDIGRSAFVNVRVEKLLLPGTLTNLDDAFHPVYYLKQIFFIGSKPSVQNAAYLPDCNHEFQSFNDWTCTETVCPYVDGTLVDECGVCGGPGILPGTCDCEGTPFPAGKCDCEGNDLDVCGVCGGPGFPAGKCDCDGQTGFPEGACDCEGNGFPAGKCDCEGNDLDVCGVCGGPGFPAGKCDCDGQTGFPEGACDCEGNVFDGCGVCGGSGISGICDTTIMMYDSYGDSWNGFVLTAYTTDNLNGVEFTLESGSYGERTISNLLGLEVTDDGGYPSEVSYTIIRHDGTEVTGSTTSGVVHDFCGYLVLGNECWTTWGDCGSDFPEGTCDCDGTPPDECGVCGGPGILPGKCDCDGTGFPEGTCDCDGNVLDACEVCGGPGFPPGKCDCYGGTACLSSKHGTLILPDKESLEAAYRASECV